MVATPPACAGLGLGTFAVVGFLFGGVAGALTWRKGQAAGGPLGKLVAETFSRSAAGLSPGLYGFLVGSADGALFLGVVGLLIGYLGGLGALLLALAALVSLCAGALLFGGLANGLIGGHNRLLAAACGLLVGAAVGLTMTDGRWYGTLAGALIGLGVGWRGRARAYQEPGDDGAGS